MGAAYSWSITECRGTLWPISEEQVGISRNGHAEVSTCPILPVLCQWLPGNAFDVDLFESPGNAVEACGTDDVIEFPLILRSLDALFGESLNRC